MNYTFIVVKYSSLFFIIFMNKINFFVYVLFIQTFSFLNASGIWPSKVLHQDPRSFSSQHPDNRLLDATIGDLGW